MAEDRTRTSTVVNDFFGGVAKCTQRDSVRECIDAKEKWRSADNVFLYYSFSIGQTEGWSWIQYHLLAFDRTSN